MKHLLSILTLALLFSLNTVEAQKDTLTLVKNVNTQVVTLKSQKSGSLVFNPYEYNGAGNTVAVYVAGTMPDTNRIEIRNANTGTVLKKYPQNKFHLQVYGITAIGATYINGFIQPPNLAQRSYTTAQRDSIFNWGLAPVGTIIFNTTLDSPQIRVTNTLNWRTF